MLFPCELFSIGYLVTDQIQCMAVTSSLIFLSAAELRVLKADWERQEESCW